MACCRHKALADHGAVTEPRWCYLQDRNKPLSCSPSAIRTRDVSEFAPAAGLGSITQVMEGDPADVGRRSSNGMRMSTETPVRTTADTKVAAAALPAARG